MQAVGPSPAAANCRTIIKTRLHLLLLLLLLTYPQKAKALPAASLLRT